MAPQWQVRRTLPLQQPAQVLPIVLRASVAFQTRVVRAGPRSSSDESDSDAEGHPPAANDPGRAAAFAGRYRASQDPLWVSNQQRTVNACRIYVTDAYHEGPIRHFL